MNYNIYIASCDENGGIYHYQLAEDGALKLIKKTAADRPMYMVKNENKMYILLRAPFEGSNESGLVVCDMNSDGSLVNMSEIMSTKGVVSCHLAVDNDNVYCVNYISGSVIKMPDTLVTHKGCGVNPARQEGPHTHYVGFTPDNKYVCVTDLGLDSVFIYNKNLEFVSKAKVPEGHGARHLVFSEDKSTCFVANELKSTVSAFKYNDGKLVLTDTVSCLPQGFEGDSFASAIRIDDGEIYVSNRGHNSISVLEYKNEKLVLKNTFDCGGSYPRDFDIVGDYIISTNEKGNNVAVINKKSFEIVYTEENIKAPICVLKV